ncbi:MAG: hypothetical protein CMLOHMNK_02057 [Steroidobacteraceae bacterium]|nr:hypothetical protein [Steroidobacteraceae bacterium]
MKRLWKRLWNAFWHWAQSWWDRGQKDKTP